MQSIGVLFKDGGRRPPLHPPYKGREKSLCCRPFSYAVALPARGGGARPRSQDGSVASRLISIAIGVVTDAVAVSRVTTTVIGGISGIRAVNKTPVRGSGGGAAR